MAPAGFDPQGRERSERIPHSPPYSIKEPTSRGLFYALPCNNAIPKQRGPVNWQSPQELTGTKNSVFSKKIHYHYNGKRACKSLYAGATRKPSIVFSYSVQNKGKLSLMSLVVVNVHSPVESGHTCAFKPHAVKIAI